VNLIEAWTAITQTREVKPSNGHVGMLKNTLYALSSAIRGNLDTQQFLSAVEVLVSQQRLVSRTETNNTSVAVNRDLVLEKQTRSVSFVEQLYLVANEFILATFSDQNSLVPEDVTITTVSEIGRKVWTLVGDIVEERDYTHDTICNHAKSDQLNGQSLSDLYIDTSLANSFLTSDWIELAFKTAIRLTSDCCENKKGEICRPHCPAIDSISQRALLHAILVSLKQMLKGQQTVAAESLEVICSAREKASAFGLQEDQLVASTLLGLLKNSGLDLGSPLVPAYQNKLTNLEPVLLYLQQQEDSMSSNMDDN
jgi:hypothetical protein